MKVLKIKIYAFGQCTIKERRHIKKWADREWPGRKLIITDDNSSGCPCCGSKED